MKASTFQPLIVGSLCLAVSGLSGGLYNQYQRVTELENANAQRLQTLGTLQRDSSTLLAAQEKLQDAMKDLKQMVDSGEQQANTLDPMLDQWTQEIQELRDGLTARATEADMIALRARLEHVEQQLLEFKTQPSLPPPMPSSAESNNAAKPAPLLPPFSVLGVESRGGERFLAVATPDSRSLKDIRLLHNGERLGTWQLKALVPNAAVFTVPTQADQTVQLP